jgi:hypothetical protein
MTKLNFNKPFVDLAGVQVMNETGEKQTLGIILSNQLALANTTDFMKFSDWAIKIFKNETIQVDDTDYEKILKFVETHPHLTATAKRQLIDHIKKAKK